MSVGSGTAVPGSRTAARPKATAVRRRSPGDPSAVRKPARVESPAPTVDSGTSGGPPAHHDAVGEHEQGAVRAEADQDGPGARRDDLAGGVDDVADGRQLAPDELGELLVVGLDEREPALPDGAGRAAPRRCRGRTARRTGQPDRRPARRTSPARRAAGCPRTTSAAGRVASCVSTRGEQRVDLVRREPRARRVDLGGRAVPLDERDVGAGVRRRAGPPGSARRSRRAARPGARRRHRRSAGPRGSGRRGGPGRGTTLMPLPPASTRCPPWARLTSPHPSTSTSSVRSRLGFGVSVMIMRSPPAGRRPRSPSTSSGSTPLSVMIVSTSDSGTTWANSSRPNLSGRPARRCAGALATSARLTAASARSGVVSPCSTLSPLVPRKATSAWMSAQLALRPRPDGGERPAADRAADEVQRDVRPLASTIATGSACVTTVSSRSDGSSSASRTVVVPASRMIAPPSGSSSSAALAIRSFSPAKRALAVGDAGLEAEPLDRDGAAVHPAHEPVPLQHREVAADGLRGDVEVLGQPVARRPGRRRAPWRGSAGAARVRTHRLRRPARRP